MSEVLEDGFHLFTGIVRDLTEEVAKERMRQAEEDCLPQMIWKSGPTGQAEALNKRFRNYTGVSEQDTKSVNLFQEGVIHDGNVNTLICR